MANTNAFRSVAGKYQDSPIVVLIFAASLAMLVFGVNNFAEDVYSSYLGIQQIEAAYGLNVQIWTFTYWVMSASFQVATIVFFFLFMSTGERKFMWITFAVQFVDFFADAWYRSNGQLFKSPGYAVMSSGFTFVFFTVGSEVFITIGFGLVMALYAPAIREFKRSLGDIERAYKGGGDKGRHEQPQFKPTKPNGGGDFPHKDSPLSGAERARMKYQGSNRGSKDDLGDTGKFPAVRQ